MNFHPENPKAQGATVVTGSANGIGRAIVYGLMEAGEQVVIADVNDEAGFRLRDESVQKYGADRIAYIRADVREEQEVAAAVDFAVDTFGSLRAVVNNAGVGGAFGPIDQLDASDWDYTFEVLTRGVFFGTKHAARVLKQQGGGGGILNIASVAALGGGYAAQAYSAAKAAVVNLTQNTAVELAQHRIRVNAICPGTILTPLVHGGNSDRVAALLAEHGQPWPDYGRPEDIAAAALFLLGDSARFITGESLVVDGGLAAMGPGKEYRERLRTDPGSAGFVGVNKGTTGEASLLRSRP